MCAKQRKQKELGLTGGFGLEIDFHSLNSHLINSHLVKPDRKEGRNSG